MDYERAVKTSSDISDLYNYVLQHPEIACYRAYVAGSEDGDSYYWNRERNTHSCEHGRVFFPNPNYVNPNEKLDFSLDELYGA